MGVDFIPGPFPQKNPGENFIWVKWIDFGELYLLQDHLRGGEKRSLFCRGDFPKFPPKRGF